MGENTFETVAYVGCWKVATLFVFTSTRCMFGKMGSASVLMSNIVVVKRRKMASTSQLLQQNFLPPQIMKLLNVRKRLKTIYTVRLVCTILCQKIRLAVSIVHASYARIYVQKATSLSDICV